jgi:hypothetical protein
VIFFRKQIFLWYLEALMGGRAGRTEIDIDRVFAALARITHRHEVVAKRVSSEIEDRQQPGAAANLAALDLGQRLSGRF